MLTSLEVREAANLARRQRYAGQPEDLRQAHNQPRREERDAMSEELREPANQARREAWRNRLNYLL